MVKTLSATNPPPFKLIPKNKKLLKSSKVRKWLKHAEEVIWEKHEKEIEERVRASMEFERSLTPYGKRKTNGLFGYHNRAKSKTRLSARPRYTSSQSRP
jgi:hypothetical protein